MHYIINTAGNKIEIGAMKLSVIFYLLLISLGIFHSCTIQKRKYREGFYVNWNKETSHRTYAVNPSSDTSYQAAPIASRQDSKCSPAIKQSIDTAETKPYHWFMQPKHYSQGKVSKEIFRDNFNRQTPTRNYPEEEETPNKMLYIVLFVLSLALAVGSIIGLVLFTGVVWLLLFFLFMIASLSFAIVSGIADPAKSKKDNTEDETDKLEDGSTLNHTAEIARILGLISLILLGIVLLFVLISFLIMAWEIFTIPFIFLASVLGICSVLTIVFAILALARISANKTLYYGKFIATRALIQGIGALLGCLAILAKAATIWT